MKYLLLFLICFLPLVADAQQKLWYRQPAEKWTDALPIGNAHLGAMLYGGVDNDHIQFNESTLWTGRPRQYHRDGAAAALPAIRQFLFEGKQKEADSLAEEKFMGLKYPDDETHRQKKAAWFKAVRQDTALAARDYDDSQLEERTLLTPNGWEAAGWEGLNGAVWFRTAVNIPAAWAGKNLVIDIGRVREADYTYVNGQLIGHFESTSHKRKYTIPSSVWQPGRNSIAIQVLNYYDKGGFIGVKEEGVKTFLIYPENSREQAITLPAKWKYKIQRDDAPADIPQYEANYLPFADLWLQFPEHTSYSDYKRELDIERAVSKITYVHNGRRFTREYFVSAPDQAMVVHCSSEDGAKISMSTLFKSPHKNYRLKKISDSVMAIYVQPENSVLKGVAYMQVQANGGDLEITENEIKVRQASDITLYITAATSFSNYKEVSADPEKLCRERIVRKKYPVVKAAHIRDYQQYYQTLSLQLPAGEQAGLPTDERIRRFDISRDPSFVALYLQYARYLLISSSRPGSQPANLQGIWNDLLMPPWGSKYTTNINLQMNYWPAEVLNLSPTAMPLFQMIKELKEQGTHTAKAHYNAPGWVLHHNTDLWRGTAPINAANHGIWPTGGAWLCQHIWEHYLFSQDKAFLREHYPLMRAAAEFFVFTLVKDPVSGKLISTPSNSPEQGGLVAGPAMDHQIIRELFRNCISAAVVLNTDATFRQTLQEKSREIAPNKIGKHGQLQEWMQDMDDPANQHRHVSHLWGVFPGTDISWKEADLMKAARQSLLFRGDGGTGWSLAWKVNLWARLKDGEHALTVLKALMEPAITAGGSEKGGVYNNLFDAHPPFQIDGNFGGAAGIAEMLLQSHETVLEILPALPAALPEGIIKGIRARGGFELQIQWKEGKLTSLEVSSIHTKNCSLKYGPHSIRFLAEKGKTYRLNGQLQLPGK